MWTQLSSYFVWCLGTLHLIFLSSLPLTLSFSLISSLPQKSWKKWDPCWPRQAVRFCKLTALIMSFCYSDTRSAWPSHWPRSQPWGEAGPVVGQGPWIWSPLPPLALKKEMEGLNAKEGGSSLENGAAKKLPGCYSGGTALGKQISV